VRQQEEAADGEASLENLLRGGGRTWTVM